YKGYGPCHNSEEIIAEKAYDSEADIANPTGSVFCSHGAGFVVPWDQVEQYMHVKTDSKNGEMYDIENVPVIRSASNTYRDSYATDKELEEIFEKNIRTNKKKEVY
ncbi:small GTP-binding protein domain protein, partial [human gut metagenome]